MLMTFLVIAGVLLGLVGLLALIVSLSARPATRPRGGWVAETGRRHPDAWSAPGSPATADGICRASHTGHSRPGRIRTAGRGLTVPGMGCLPRDG